MHWTVFRAVPSAARQMKSRPVARARPSTLTRERERVRQLMEANGLVAPAEDVTWHALPGPEAIPDNVIPFPIAAKRSDAL